MTEFRNRQIAMAARPEGDLQPTDFRLEELQRGVSARTGQMLEGFRYDPA